jgi:cytochrome c biogenesis protein CcmG/thiol:disulfide interchange protein DsbE
MRRRVTVVAALASAAVVGACDREPGERARGVVAVGREVPDYRSARLDGTPVALTELRGRVVLLNIWATWCKPCRQEVPALDTLYARHRAQGLEVVGVSIDQPGDSAKIVTFARELGASYTLWHDPDDIVSTTFLSIGVPSSYLVGRDGTLRWRHVGPVTAGDSALNAALDAALAEPGVGASPGGPT